MRWSPMDFSHCWNSLIRFPGCLSRSLPVSPSGNSLTAGIPKWRHESGKLIGTGQIEPLGGPACDVVLAAVPGRDRIGQVKVQGEVVGDALGCAAHLWLGASPNLGTDDGRRSGRGGARVGHPVAGSD
ncbi:MAG: hypothetical protein CM1200mP2_14690 [Planctomycetaceae bacterium]|nr:MAG: hypothetical protein CM1200mP2_14690 [Planctomycetaceae bacterium]